MVATYCNSNAGPNGTIFPSELTAIYLSGRSFADFSRHVVSVRALRQQAIPSVLRLPGLPWGPPNVVRITVDAATRTIDDLESDGPTNSTLAISKTLKTLSAITPSALITPFRHQPSAAFKQMRLVSRPPLACSWPPSTNNGRQHVRARLYPGEILPERSGEEHCRLYRWMGNEVCPAAGKGPIGDDWTASPALRARNSLLVARIRRKTSLSLLKR